MDLTPRQKLIFKTIVEQFTYLAEPIGSKTLMQLLDIPISSATIRNEMAVLEKEGLLEKTHTSSGRIPSQKGYRYYVENLMVTKLDQDVEVSLKTLFTQRQFSLDEIVRTSCSILSEMTHLTSIALGPETENQTLANIQLVPITSRQAVGIIVTSSGHAENQIFNFTEDVSVSDVKTCTALLNDQLHGVRLDEIANRLKSIEPLMAARLARHEVLLDAFTAAFMQFASSETAVYGRANMLCQPEFSDISRLRQLMEILENSSMFKAWTEQEDNILVPIGTRNELIQIGDCSVLSTRFSVGREEGKLMIVGPNRMPYGKVVALMDYVSSVIEGVFENRTEGDPNKHGQET